MHPQMQIKSKIRLLDAALGTIMLSDKLAMPTERVFRENGRMIAPAVIAKVGIMDYYAHELGDLFKDRDPNSIVKVMTSKEALSDAKHLESGRSSPISVGHQGDITAENSKEHQIGQLEGIPLWDEETGTITASIVINDASALALVKEGVSQLSSGHDTVLIRVDDKEGWECEKTEIRINHVAIVPKGRAGESAKIADETAETETIKLADATAKLTDLQAKYLKTEVARDDAIQKLADAEAKLVTAIAAGSDSVIEKLVDARMLFLTEVATISDEDVKAMSTTAAKRHVVSKIIDLDVTEKKDDYIDMRYQILLEDHKLDTGETDMTIALRKNANTKVVDAEPQSAAEISRLKMINRHQGTK